MGRQPISKPVIRHSELQSQLKNQIRVLGYVNAKEENSYEKHDESE